MNQYYASFDWVWDGLRASFLHQLHFLALCLLKKKNIYIKSCAASLASFSTKSGEQVA
jgi:hypothetical protein